MAIILMLLASPFLLAATALFRATALFWPTMLAIGALHSNVPVVPATGWFTTWLLLFITSLLFAAGESSDSG